MHLVKNIVEHVVNVIVSSEDSVKVHKEEEQCMRFPSAWVKDKQNTLPKAPSSLMRDEISLADKRANGICVPTPRAIFGKSSGMKSHTHHAHSTHLHMHTHMHKRRTHTTCMHTEHTTRTHTANMQSKAV